MHLSPRAVSETQFKAASAEAALFELRLRMTAGTIAAAQHLPIDVNLVQVRDAVLLHFQSELSEEDIELIERATTLRNKLLHCEFSAARQKLNAITPKLREGKVIELPVAGLGHTELAEAIKAMAFGTDIGAQLVSQTKVRTLKDIFGWLLEFQSAAEFKEAESVFVAAINVIERRQQARCGVQQSNT